VTDARRRAVPVWSEVELASRLLPNPILGVTGTNGKTTTAEWLGFILGAPVAGNVGRALSELDSEVDADQLVVCELSSFQLEDIVEFRPRIAVLLNLEPDHLDRHGSFEAYRDAKVRIFANQTGDDVAVVPRGFDDELRGRRVEFAADDTLPAEPPSAERTTARTGLRRRRRRAQPARAMTRSPEACASSKAFPTGSSSSPSAAASPT
jgi:UDP-N-acetylmuramoylalanine--D-glutamate ligase